MVDSATRRVVSRYADAKRGLRTNVQGVVRRQWQALDSYNRADIRRFARAASPIVEAGQVRTAALTDAYLTNVERVMRGRAKPARGVPRKLITDEAMRGVPTGQVYERAGVTVWSALADAVPYADAVARGLARALSSSATDLQLASTHAARYIGDQSPTIIGYRRVTNGQCCDLCELAASRLYHVEDLLPIHSQCTCSVIPVYRSDDPGAVALGQPSDEDIGDAYSVHDHGELGPVLAVKGQDFTGADDF